MHIAGSRRILAPADRVRTALTDPAFLKASLPPGVADQAHLGAHEPDEGVTWRLPGGEAVFRIAGGTKDATQLGYDADTDAGEEARLKASIDALLDTLQSEIAGPRETGAQGPMIGLAKAAQSGFPFRAMPNMIFGMPLIFWAGSAIFFLIFVFMFGAYL